VSPPVFGEFLDAGRKDLEEAVVDWDRQDAHLPGVLPPLHRLVTVMSLCFEDLAACDEIEAAGRTDLHVWERAVIDAGAALRIAADCLHRSMADQDSSEPAGNRALSRARYLADAAASLAVGRDLLHTHFVPGPDGLVQEQSDWAPVVTSLSVMRGLANEIATWSARLAPYTAWLAVLASPCASRLVVDQPFASSPREELVSASQWLRAACAALRWALDADAVLREDAELLHAIPPALPPQRQPLGLAGESGESIAELCSGITVSTSRLGAAAQRDRDRGSWSPDLTSGGWQWMAQAAAITSHLTELALRSLAVRAGQLAGLPVTEEQLHKSANSMIAMRQAWQRVDLMWNTVITERRLLPTQAMSEASDLLLRMGRLVWDNPQWTPARADRGPRRVPAALAPGTAAFTAVVSAAHSAVDALGRVAVAEIATVEAAARNGRLYVPTRSLPDGFDVPRPFAPALIETVLEVQDAYHDAAEMSLRAALELDEIAIAVAAPSKTLALARAAALVQTRRQGGQDIYLDGDGRDDLPRRAGVAFGHSRASTGLPGPVERAVRQCRVYDPVILLRAAAIDNAAKNLIGLAEYGYAPREPDAQEVATGALHAHDPVQLAAQSFPPDTVVTQSVNVSSSGLSGPPSDRVHLRKN
jgi:hypothetical protein